MRPFFENGTEVGALMQTRDWSATSLGTPETWPQSLRTIVRILLTSRYAMWLGWGPDLTLLYNDAYGRILGAKHPDALGRPTREVWREIWPDIGPRIERVLKTGEATFDEGLLLLMERHGYTEETYFTFSYSPLFDDAGAIAGNFCVVTEDTERIIGERRLALLRDLASCLAQATSEREVFQGVRRCLTQESRDIPFSALYRFDGDGQARAAAWTGLEQELSGAAIDLAGSDVPWQLDQIAGGAASVIVPASSADVPALPAQPWGVAPIQALVMPLPHQGQPGAAGAFVAGVNPYRPLDDAYRTFLGLFAGQVAASLANARVYEEERRRSEGLAAIDRAKTAFFSNVSHEFRTPLTLMLGPTEDALASGGVMRREQLETVHRNELRLLKLVNSLLDFSRIEAGRTQAVYEPTDLAALTADLASTFRSAIERGGLIFEVACEPVPEPVYVDRQMWEKIVLNLLSNAFKFTLEGRIRVTLRRDGGEAVLTVEDTGVGVPAAELPRLFERFYRIEGTRARTHEGSGIGLALVQDLVQLHNGHIDVVSEPGRGTTFTVRVALGVGHLPPERIGTAAAWSPTGVTTRAFVSEAERWLGGMPDGAPETRPAATDAPESARERARIVLADDNADMRDYVRHLLEPRWAVEVAANGMQALTAVQRTRPDLLITDVMMAELDGVGLVRRLREDPLTREMPILMLSARAGEDARLEGLQAGADDYLVKPFSARELLARVEMQLLRASMRAVENLQRRQLADIFRQAPAAIAILRGPDHVYEHANPAYAALVGGRDVIGKPIRVALPELAGQGIFEVLDRVYATGEPYVGRALRLLLLRDSAASPEESYFDFVYEPMRDATGEIDGIAVVAFDVSELVKARREAEAASRTKDEFLAMLGHELRNPLGPILTALQLMRLRGGETLERERTVIERQTRHLVRLVDDLLDVSRIARGKIDLRRERVDVSEVVAKAIEMASPLLEDRQHDLVVDVPRGLQLDADPARLAQVIANLLTNAAKYTEPGGRVSVRAAIDHDQIVLRVRDNGIGIAAEMLPRVFDMFAQEGQSLDRAQGGLGLGLTIVRNLVSLHGGTVEARSEGRGYGSEFIVRLPSVVSGAPARVDAGTTGAVHTAADGVHVLIVDDNVDAAAMLALYLEGLSYTVRAVHDGPAALRVAAEFRPVVALLDIGLPVMDGYELAGRLRQLPELPGLKLLAITGYGQEADRERARRAGFDAHMVKPVDLDALAHILGRLVAAAP